MYILKKDPIFDGGSEKEWKEHSADYIQCECGCSTFETTYGDYEILGKCTKCKHIYSLYSG